MSNEKVIGKALCASGPEPACGDITSDMYIPEFTPIDLSGTADARAEVGLAFVMKEKIGAPRVLHCHILSAAQGVVPAVKVTCKNPGGTESVRYVFGARLTAMSGLDLRNEGVTIEKDLQLIRSSSGSAVMGSPVRAAAYLANKLLEKGEYIEAGDYVYVGPLAPAVSVSAGDVVDAFFSKLCHIRAIF